MARQSPPAAAGTIAGTIKVNAFAIPAPPPEPRPGQVRTRTPEEERPLRPTDTCELHGPFWSIFEVNGFPLCPVEAIEAIEAGTAVLDDPGAAHEAIVRLERNARMVFTNTRPDSIDVVQGEYELRAEDDSLVIAGRPDHWFGPGELASTYYGALGADAHRRHVETARRAAEAAGIAPGDDLPPGYIAPLLTPAQVCEVLQVSPRTLDRIEGRSIPRALRIGGQRRWNAAVLAEFLSRGVQKEAVAA